MNLFRFQIENEATSPVPEKKGGLIETPGTTQSTRGRVIATAINEELDPALLAVSYQACLDELVGIVQTRPKDETGMIRVEKVTVKLGVGAGGKIGWFVEGRADVSLAFEVEFKVSV